MDQLPSLKANEKLPRGSYFYVQVGDRFYAGEMAETREVELDPSNRPALTIYDKNGSFSQDLQRYDRRRYWWASRSRGPRGARADRDARKGSTPTYAKPHKRPETIIRKEQTGKLVPKLVDEQNKAKQYRRKDLVQNACDRLKGVYGDLGVQITVRYEKGDTE